MMRLGQVQRYAQNIFNSWLDASVRPNRKPLSQPLCSRKIVLESLILLGVIPYLASLIVVNVGNIDGRMMIDCFYGCDKATYTPICGVVLAQCYTTSLNTVLQQIPTVNHIADQRAKDTSFVCLF